MQQLNELDSCIVLNSINCMDTLSQNYNVYKNKVVYYDIFFKYIYIYTYT